MTGSGNKPQGDDGESLAQSYFSGLDHDDPTFLKLKSLLLNGRRAEAMKLIRDNDSRFEDPHAQELVSLIMSTLRDTIIDP